MNKRKKENLKQKKVKKEGRKTYTYRKKENQSREKKSWI